MITQLKIEGFKSFGSPEETIDLGPLNFVVGANASGKTNLLSALRFLQNAVLHDVSYAVSEMGGNAEVRNKRLRQRREPKPVRLSLKLEKEVPFSMAEDPDAEDNLSVVRSFEYKLDLDLRSDDRTPSIEKESLEAKLVRNGKTHNMRLLRSGEEVLVIDPTSGNGAHQTVPVPEQEPTRLALVGVGFFSVPATILREDIRCWRFHSFIPSVARQPYREEPDATLGPAGEKLAAIQSSPLITIEEPENGLHPHLAESLVEILRSASEGSQVIVTTHSPTLLDHLEPQEVILCDKTDGFTRLKRASSVVDIDRLREHFSLGELWSQGAVGAVP